MAQSLNETYRNLLRRCLSELPDEDRQEALSLLEEGKPEEQALMGEWLTSRLHPVVAELAKVSKKLDTLDRAAFSQLKTAVLLTLRTCPDFVWLFVYKMVEEHPDITSVWLFGSRANGGVSETSDWDIMICGPRKLAGQLSLSQQERIDLQFVDEASCEFRKPWKTETPEWREFGSWSWRQASRNEADYTGELGIPQKALRLWPV